VGIAIDQLQALFEGCCRPS